MKQEPLYESVITAWWERKGSISDVPSAADVIEAVADWLEHYSKTHKNPKGFGSAIHVLKIQAEIARDTD
jgi:hypothetical protein